MNSELTIDPGRTALLLIDLQEEHRIDSRYLVANYEGVLGNARNLLAVARQNKILVLHGTFSRDFDTEPPRPFEPVTKEGSPWFSDTDLEESSFCQEVAPLSEEAIVTKQDSSCFKNTVLKEMLTRAAVEWLVICGVWTECCVAETVRDAQALGLRVLLVKDACGSGTAAMHQTAIVNLANRLYGGAVVKADAASTLLAGYSAPAWQCQEPVPLRYDIATLSQIYQSLGRIDEP